MVALENITNPKGDVLEFDDKVRSYSRSGPHRKAPRTSSASGLGDMLETLYSEHHYLASLLDHFEKESARLKPGKIPDYDLLLDIVDYLIHYPEVYHHPREDVLFTTMVEHDDEFRPRFERLERDHQTLKRYNHELFQELTAIVAGRAADRRALLRSIERYIAAYRAHMDYEAREIFPRAKGRLSAAEQKQLDDKTRYIDDPLFGGEIQYRYRRLGRNLQARVEAAGQDLLDSEFSAIQSTIGRLSGLVDSLSDLKSVIERQGSQSWREQKETIRQHLREGGGPDIVSLATELMRNHGRHLRQGVAEIRQILNGDARGAGIDERKR